MKTQSFFIPGPLPGLNEIMEANLKRSRNSYAWNAYAEMKRRWGRECSLQIMSAKILPVVQCYLVFTWREPNKKRDPDNVAVGKKFVLDALLLAGVLKNDGWKQVLGFEDYWEVDKVKPGVFVELKYIELKCDAK